MKQPGKIESLDLPLSEDGCRLYGETGRAFGTDNFAAKAFCPFLAYRKDGFLCVRFNKRLRVERYESHQIKDFKRCAACRKAATHIKIGVGTL